MRESDRASPYRRHLRELELLSHEFAPALLKLQRLPQSLRLLRAVLPAEIG